MNTQSLRLAFGFSLFVASLAFFVIGSWLVVHSVRHIGDLTEAQTTLGIEHIGNVTGSPHAVDLILGAGMIFGSIFYSYRSYRRAPEEVEEKFEDDDRDIEFEPTKTGKMIALMKAHAGKKRE